MSSRFAGPYILVTDDDGHWYVIPQSRQKAFDDWVASPNNDGTCPDWTDSLGCSPSNVSFPTYTVR